MKTHRQQISRTATIIGTVDLFKLDEEVASLSDAVNFTTAGLLVKPALQNWRFNFLPIIILIAVVKL